jgi:hypothetical protein
MEQFSTSSSCLTYDINMDPTTSGWILIKSYSPWMMKNILPPFVSKGKLNVDSNFDNMTIDFQFGKNPI